METFTQIQDIDAPASQVWEILANPQRDREWRSDVQWLWSDPAGPVVEGTRTREVVRVGGRRYATEAVVDSVDPGRSYSWRTTDGIDARGSRSVTPLAGGRCEVTVRWHLEPEGLDRLLLPMLKVSLARAAERDLVTLAALAADTHAAVTAQATPALA